ncbi:ATPase [Vibrio cincinnatiensis]|nr:ATPase [Vibrio cincinnatiensis]
MRDPNLPRTAFVHLFEWKWNDVAQECEEFLGPKGFSAVQVSPPQESIPGPQWWTRYQPVSYEFTGRSGNRAEFADMVKRCKAVGVDIYVDAVINHMAAWSYDFAKVPFGNNDFNDCRSDIQDSDYQNDPWRVQNCNLVGLNDLKTSSEYVRQKIADFMNDALSMGVAGFRLDASKHMPAGDIAAILGKLNNTTEGARPYIFQEVIGSGDQPIKTFDYTSNGDVTEFNYARTLGAKFKNNEGTIKELGGIGSWGGWLASSSAVPFVTNHDEERHNPDKTLLYKDGDNYTLANIFMLAYPYGYPKVMSGYQFTDFDAGPPDSGIHSGNACQFDGGDWVCEHRWRQVTNMVEFRNYTVGQWKVTNWWDNGNNQIAFGRGGLGFVVINKEGYSIDRSFSTGMPAGEYCNIIAGDYDSQSKVCEGPIVSVDGSGNAHFSVSSMDAAAIHVGARVGN